MFLFVVLGRPSTEFTVEFWVNIVDPMLSYQTVMTYSSPTTPNEVQIGIAPDYIRVWKKSLSVSCDDPRCRITRAGWTHVSARWVRATGTVDLLVNGVMVFSASGTGEMQNPVEGGGVLLLGQEPDVPWNDVSLVVIWSVSASLLSPWFVLSRLSPLVSACLHLLLHALRLLFVVCCRCCLLSLLFVVVNVCCR